MLLAIGYFICAFASGVMFLLARFVNAVEDELYGYLALLSLVIGIVFSVGFFDFLEGVALILGILATIIGIMVGIKKLSS